MRQSALITWARAASGMGHSGKLEFASQAALQGYLRQHPKADASKHSVAKKAQQASAEKPQGEGKHGAAVVKTRDQLLSELPKNPKSGRQSYMGVDASTIQSVKEFPQSKTLTAVIKYKNNKGRVVDKYMYNEAHQQQSADRKFKRIEQMQKHYGTIQDNISKDLSSTDPKKRAAATVMKLVDDTTMRIGGSGAEKFTGSVGATTMRREHVKENPDGSLQFTFPGKSGVAWDRKVSDPKLVAAVKTFMADKSPSEKLFPTRAEDVNKYLKTVSPVKVTAKDYRTLHASAIAHGVLESLPTPKNAKELKANVDQAAKIASGKLGNTPAVCLAKYINPRVIDAYRSKHAAKES
jgi:hypothetical protein